MEKEALAHGFEGLTQFCQVDGTGGSRPRGEGTVGKQGRSPEFRVTTKQDYQEAVWGGP